ncbi:Basic-leucine zipper (bZIP) transcription factor [Botryosphaeria dothidea]|uniref:Basic-leucine zipper (BZIP) transcription factor n=1 Tax=Botryosphaeria dothidea TaxID=55169 RepID=A0A8H4NDI4_9PEZI|nr:Basic-leucine zipper (bZIP) transcription factor [Botryosphaeria dothidea]
MAHHHSMDFTTNNNTNVSRLSHDSKPASNFFDDNDFANDSLLDNQTTVMSPTTSAAGIFSPEASFFDNDFAAPAYLDRSANVSTNPFFQGNNNNPYMRQSQAQQMPAIYDQQQPVWPPMAEEDSRTPASNMFGQDYDSNYLAVGSTEPNAFSGLPMNVRPASVFQPTPSGNPPSPHSNKEWMAMAAQEMESRPINKRMRPNTPPARSFSPFPRRDGIRKKNARFEIPPERSLLNIDQLIAQSTNEEEIKELKQQKRLLRNRQAALDSRQRKKKHTEELEEEKKLWTERVVQLEEELQSMRLQCEAAMHEKEQWQRQQLEAQQIIDTLQWEKEEMVRTHTLETGELRKKVSILTEKLESQSSPAMAAVPSSTFTDFANDMDNLNMGGNEWDSYIYNDFCMEEANGQQPQQQPMETSLVVSRNKKDATEPEKPAASGLLLMLLLCGAFVASNSGSSAPAIPRMPEDVRAASASVLDSIFKDAGVEPSAQSAHNLLVNRVEALEPAPSGTAWPKSTLSGAEFASISHSTSNSHFDQLHTQLTQPSKEQEAEQVFSITPSQYNSLTSTDFGRRDEGTPPATPTSQHRRNLAETLATMREERKGETAAEVYTRSLLWDKIPTEVVREFKRMVEESGSLAGGSSPGSVKSEAANV